jgi:hypothetical protein
MPPELVRVHFTMKINTADADSAAVQPPAVPGKQLPDRIGPATIFSKQFQVQVNAVNMIVNGQNVGTLARFFELFGLGQYHLDRGTGLSVSESLGADSVTSAAGHKMVEAGPLNILFFEEVKQSVQVLNIPLCQRQAKADSHTCVPTIPYTLHSPVKRSFNRSEFVVDRAYAIEAYSYVRDVMGLYLPGYISSYQGTVG